MKILEAVAYATAYTLIAIFAIFFVIVITLLSPVLFFICGLFGDDDND